MAGKGLTKLQRQEALMQELKINPFRTDQELARKFGVSVQTIRLDRLSLGIPELRKRMHSVATQAYEKVRSLAESEVVGSLIDLELGVRGISLMRIEPEMVLAKTKIARGHYLFAQANSLAVAIIDAEVVLTGSARVRFKRPVYVGEEVIAKGVVKMQKGRNFLVSVYSRVEADTVFKGQYVVSVQDESMPREAMHA